MVLPRTAEEWDRAAVTLAAALRSGDVPELPCRFLDMGCRSPATHVVYVPAGCVCWRDPVQSLCEQHFITAQSEGPMHELFDWRRAEVMQIGGTDAG